jgi:hypothetical protein
MGVLLLVFSSAPCFAALVAAHSQSFPMREKLSYLVPLAVGGLLALLLIWRLVVVERDSLAALAQRDNAVAQTAGPHATAAVPIALTKAERAILGTEAAMRQLLSKLEPQLVRREARPHESVLTFKDADAYRKFLARARESGLTILGQLDAFNTVRVGFDSLSALEGDVLQNAADYQDVTANFNIQIPHAPPVEERAAVNQVPFGNRMLDFLGVAGDTSQWGRGVTIAVLDSGVMPDSTFGQGRVRYLDIGLGTTAGNGTEDGHGTAVAALAAGAASDAPGVAPAASILSIRVTGADGTSDIFTLSQAIVAAVDAGARIVNVSLGGYATTGMLNQAIAYANAQGAVIVASAGNDQAAQLTWPAADPRVISVGAVDAAGQQVYFSNSGPQLQMTAPGYGIQTAWLDGQRVVFDGTSASAPIVAGAIAVMMSQNPGLTAPQAWQVLQQYASDGGPPGPDPAFGNGILNVGWAMNRTDTARVDTAVSSNYYDAASGEMQFVVQNRSGHALGGLQLNVDANGANTPYSVPWLDVGATYVVKVPVDQAGLEAAGQIVYRAQLVNPPGVTDAVPANNRKTSVLTPPKK